MVASLQVSARILAAACICGAVGYRLGSGIVLLLAAVLAQAAVLMASYVASTNLWLEGHRWLASLIVGLPILVGLLAGVAAWRLGGSSGLAIVILVTCIEVVIVIAGELLNRLLNRREVRYAVFFAMLAALTVGTALGFGERTDLVGSSDPNPAAQFRLVAMGDSYMSGEGAHQFYAATDKSNNRCHEAPSAYARLIAEENAWGLSFLACQGARTYNVVDSITGHKAEFPGDDPDVPGSVEQIVQLRKVDDPEIVLISIGGNDAGFADLAEDCILHPCLNRAQTYLDNLTHVVGPAVEHTFEDVKAAAEQNVNPGEANPNVAVFALTYPDPLGGDCPAVGMTTPEVSWIRSRFLVTLNAVITMAAQQAQLRVIPVADALAGHGICNRAEQAVNVLTYGHGAGSVLSLVLKNPTALISGTFHPNEYGHTLLEVPIANAIREYLSGNSPNPPAPEHPSTTPPVGAPPGNQPGEVTDPFPSGTACLGNKVSNSLIVPIHDFRTSLALSSLAPMSTVCFRAQDGEWRSVEADASGAVQIPIGLPASTTSAMEILVQRPNQTWIRLEVLQTLDRTEIGVPPTPVVESSQMWSPAISWGLATLPLAFFLAMAIAAWRWMQWPWLAGITL
jgi:hypothetical protein